MAQVIAQPIKKQSVKPVQKEAFKPIQREKSLKKEPKDFIKKVKISSLMG
jgi:hypothetical protein